MSLSPEFVARGLKLAKDAHLFGVPFDEMSREELIAAAATGWKHYTDQLDNSLRTLKIIRQLATNKESHE